LVADDSLVSMFGVNMDFSDKGRILTENVYTVSGYEATNTH